MKHLWAVLLLLICCSCKKDLGKNNTVPPVTEDTTTLIEYHKDLVIVNWNIRWFGTPFFDNDPEQQAVNVGKILKYLDADLFGICEVVDTARFGKMVRQYLGEAFRYVVSPYPKIDQKLAVIYNRHIFRNVQARPFMALSITAYNSFASGRFPFLVHAIVTVNGQRTPVSFILIHAKSDEDLSSYTRRFNGAVELKDSLDTYFNAQNCMLFGDYNDQLQGSITAGKTSPYASFVKDTIRYMAVTLPLNGGGYQSMIDFPNSVIDQQIVTGHMKRWYVPGTAQIRTDVETVIPDYDAHNTSDHYPVSATYRIQP